MGHMRSHAACERLGHALLRSCALCSCTCLFCQQTVHARDATAPQSLARLENAAHMTRMPPSPPPPPLSARPRQKMSYRRPALALLLALVVCCAPTEATGRAARTLQQAPQPAAADGAAADGAAAAPAPAGLRGSDKDARLLLALKDSLENGDAVLASWQPGSDPCAWEGVTCDASGAVTVL